MSEIQLETPNNLQSGGLKEVKGSSIKYFFKEYKYEILLGLIILGAIVFKLLFLLSIFKVVSFGYF